MSSLLSIVLFLFDAVAPVLLDVEFSVMFDPRGEERSRIGRDNGLLCSGYGEFISRYLLHYYLPCIAPRFKTCTVHHRYHQRNTNRCTGDRIPIQAIPGGHYLLAELEFFLTLQLNVLHEVHVCL